jgi:glycosyltransferase involved in cell wall biosynthesis
MIASPNGPLISIIMPVYNTEKFLRESIDSLLRQTYDHFELIIINDGSSDNSQKIIDYYAKLDSRIHAINQSNKGVVATCNYAASLAKGAYINRHDSDDVAFDTKLEHLVQQACEHPNAVIVTGSIEAISEEGEFVYRELVPLTDDDIKRALYMRNPIPNGATLVKKEAFDSVNGYDEVFAEDCHLWTKLFSEGEFTATPKIVYKWRLNLSGLTHTNNQKSIEKEREYVQYLWEATAPRPLTRLEIKHKSATYLQDAGKHGVDFKKLFLYDLARLSIHLIKRGHSWEGIKQLFAIASTGRTGFKTVIKRLYLVVDGQLLHRKSDTFSDEDYTKSIDD